MLGKRCCLEGDFDLPRLAADLEIPLARRSHRSHRGHSKARSGVEWSFWWIIQLQTPTCPCTSWCRREDTAHREVESTTPRPWRFVSPKTLLFLSCRDRTQVCSSQAKWYNQCHWYHCYNQRRISQFRIGSRLNSQNRLRKGSIPMFRRPKLAPKSSPKDPKTPKTYRGQWRLGICV